MPQVVVGGGAAGKAILSQRVERQREKPENAGREEPFAILPPISFHEEEQRTGSAAEGAVEGGRRSVGLRVSSFAESGRGKG